MVDRNIIVFSDRSVFHNCHYSLVNAHGARIVYEAFEVFI